MEAGSRQLKKRKKKIGQGNKHYGSKFILICEKAKTTGSLALGDETLLQETDGTEYLKYTKRQTKTKSEAKPRNTITVKAIASAATDGLSVKEAQVLLLCSKRPGLMLQAGAPFYLDINHTRNSIAFFNDNWFKSNAMGVS